MNPTEPSFAQSQQIAEMPVPNLPLLRKVLDHIDAHPDEWNQEAWGVQTSASSCGTAFCIAGHALVMAGYQQVPANPADWDPNAIGFAHPETGRLVDPGEEGVRVLGLTEDEEEIFAEDNSRVAVQHFAEQIAARAGERL